MTDDGLIQVHGQDQLKLQVCYNVVDITNNSAYLIVVLFTAELTKRLNQTCSKSSRQVSNILSPSEELHSYYNRIHDNYTNPSVCYQMHTHSHASIPRPHPLLWCPLPSDVLWQYLLLLSSFLFSRTAAASVLALLVAVSIAVGPSRDLTPAGE